MENITLIMLDFVIIVENFSFVCFPKVKLALSVLKMLSVHCTDKCSKTLAGKYLCDHLLFAVVL
jgi:hypothetical protein